jgi:NADH-quinone oxidoreductase subunit J
VVVATRAAGEVAVSGREVLLVVVALAAVVGALLAVTSRRLVTSALWLLVTLVALAVGYVVLGAPMVALVQLLVYVGAVVVLVLFALMLTRAPMGVLTTLDVEPRRRVVAAVVATSTAVLVGGTLLLAVGDLTAAPDLALGGARPVGTAIFGTWVLPFEVLSLLLLAALVAAFAVARGDRDGKGRQ